MSHRRIIALCNTSLSQHERELAFGYLQEQLCPHKYDMIWLTEHERKPDEEARFWDYFPELKVMHDNGGNKLSFDFGDAYMVEREAEDFPFDKDEQVNFLKAFYYFKYHHNCYEFAFLRKWDEDDIGVIHAPSLLQGILDDTVRLDNLINGISPAWDSMYNYIITDIYDYHC